MANNSLVRAFLGFSAVVAVGACHRGGGATATSASPSPSTAVAPSGAARPAAGGLPVGLTPQMIALGDSLFHARSCVRCHGADAKGAQNGPDLTVSTHMHVNGTYEDFVRLITSGVPRDSILDKSHRFAMQPRGGNQNQLTDEQVRAVAAYVYSLSHKQGT
jgi:mono/diheme cytochrome c family protein